MRKISIVVIASLVASACFVGCNGNGEKQIVVVEDTTHIAADPNLGPAKLSEYGFFKGKLADLSPADGVVPYGLNTPLFSDYAWKLRFVKLPAGVKVAYNDKEVFDYPVGTYLIKNFYYPTDFRDTTKGRRIMETRLLVHKEKGWVALPYIWNDAQTEATLEVTGGRKDISWTHYDGAVRKISYTIPNMNQCKGCHNRGEVMMPIGPSARQLNGDYHYADGSENQLEHWIKTGMLDGLKDAKTAPKLAVWNDPKTGSINERARAYLDINCGHCHRPDGPASTSGLYVYIHEKDPAKWGVGKPPVAAGRGSGGLHSDIEPGDAAHSILAFRMDSEDPGIMMPELGRKLNHIEGIQLIKDWINSLNAKDLKNTGNSALE